MLWLHVGAIWFLWLTQNATESMRQGERTEKPHQCLPCVSEFLWLPVLGRRWTRGGCLKWASNPQKMPCALVPAQESVRAIKPLDMPMGWVWATGADPQCLCLSLCLSSLASFCGLLSCQKSWMLPPALPAMRGKKSLCLGHHCCCLIPIELFLDTESIGSISLLTLPPGKSSP